jgi:hypothetical protein
MRYVEKKNIIDDIILQVSGELSRTGMAEDAMGIKLC